MTKMLKISICAVFLFCSGCGVGIARYRELDPESNITKEVSVSVFTLWKKINFNRDGYSSDNNKLKAGYAPFWIETE